MERRRTESPVFARELSGDSSSTGSTSPVMSPALPQSRVGSMKQRNAAAQHLAQVMAYRTVDDDDEEEEEDDDLGFRFSAPPPTAFSGSNKKNGVTAIPPISASRPNRTQSLALGRNSVEQSLPVRSTSAGTSEVSIRPTTTMVAPPSKSTIRTPVAIPPIDPPTNRIRDRRFPSDIRQLNLKDTGEQREVSALLDELDMLEEENEIIIDKLRHEEKRREGAEARARELEKQVASLGVGVSLEDKLLIRKEAALRQREAALEAATQTQDGRDKDMAALHVEIQNLKDDTEAAIEQQQEAEAESVALRSMTQRMILSEEEMEEVVLKRCWLSRYWGLAVKHGICAEIAPPKNEYWSSLAPLPFEVVSSAGQKAKEESWNKRHGSDADDPDRNKPVCHFSDLTGEGNIEGMLSVEMGLRQLASLKVEVAVVLALAQHKSPNLDRQSVLDSASLGDPKFVEAFELSDEESEDVLFKEAWLIYFWRRALFHGVEEDVAEERLQFWISRSGKSPTSHDAVDVERGLLELRKLGIEQQLWEASRKEIDQPSGLAVAIRKGKDQEKELELDSDEAETEIEVPLPLTVTSRALYMLGDFTAGPAFRFTQWLQLVRKRTAKNRSSGFPHRLSTTMPSTSSIRESIENPKFEVHPDPTEISLWERLGKAAMLDIESSSFSWDNLSSLHHTEHSSSNEHSEDEMNKALEVTVNSGGVVFFAFFNCHGIADAFPKEAAAVIKISSSRMATQSERLGYEFAKWMGIQTPQARVIHYTSLEWQQIKEAAEKAREAANSEGDEIGEVTCFELLEALELSRCLFFMSYVHGSPLLENSSAFESWESKERTSEALGRVLMLDLVIRNEDRLPCRELRWRGNSANLLLAEKLISANADALEAAFDSAINRYRPKVIRALQKERRSTSVDCRLHSHDPGLMSQASDLSEISESPRSTDMSLKSQTSGESMSSDLNIVAIDSGVPRRPPAGKRADDQVNYPKLVELLINSSGYASNLLYDITGGKLGYPPPEDMDTTDVHASDKRAVVHAFRTGFRAALRDLQGFHIFLLTLHQRLDTLLRLFMNIINKISSGESDKEDSLVPDSPSLVGCGSCSSPTSKDRLANDNHQDFTDSESQRTASKALSSSNRDCCDSTPASRDGWHGKFYKGNGEPHRNLRLTAKLRDFHKYAKVDAESSKELEQWNEMLKNDAIKLCQENNFNTGFFEGSDNNSAVDAYELKVRLEHILERIALISDAASTERPSAVTSNLFIGGALAARSVYTLQYLGITHILCLCANEIGQSESQFPDIFEYKNFSVCDSEDFNITNIFEEACDFIDHVEQTGQKVLVHCFEGRSRSVSVVLAYLMLRKKYTLSEAWQALKRVHRRAHPNDGFAKLLQELDEKLHGKVSMEWQQRKPTMKVCPICGKNAGLSSSSLKLHLQKSHRKLSSGSVDSAMTMEIQKALTALKISRGGSVSPTQRSSHSIIDP